MDNQPFIAQAGADYQGTPHRIARCTDNCGEHHVIIESRLDDGSAFWLDWIGAEHAPEPDEFDELPFTGLRWTAIKGEQA